MRTFNLIRYFSLLTFALVLAVGGLLGDMLRRHELQELQRMAEDRNVAMTRIFRNALWSEFAPLVDHSANLGAEELRAAGERSRLRDKVVALMHDSETIKLKVYNLRGLTVFSTDAAQIGEDKRGNAGYLAAAGGDVASEMTHRDQFDAFEGVREERDVIASYVPVVEGGRVTGVIETYQDVTRFMQRIERGQATVWTLIGAVLGALYLVQLLVVRHAHRILHAQEDALKAANLDLDHRVLERTSELAETNRRLEAEAKERRRTQEQLEYLSYYDALTGLPNRALLLNRLQLAAAAGHQKRRHGALLFIDLDHFRAVNDADSRAEGDELLCHAARCLRRGVADGDTLARIGADQFVVLLEDVGETAEEAANLAEDIAGALRSAIESTAFFPKDARHVTCSIGITVFGTVLHPPDELLKQAELALYDAKAAGRNTQRFFDPEMQAAVAAHAALEADLHQGLVERQFLLYYQPQVSHEGAIVAAEALLRWRHPVRGMVPPAEFIPFAEETGLILPLGRWVLESACRQLAEWAPDPAFASLTVAVNVSARQFHQEGFVDEVLAVLAATGAPAGRLKLELTESLLLVDTDDAVAKMQQLRARGLSFSLDDFGTGYSSLSYLTRLPLDQLKVDRSFVSGIEMHDEDAVLCASIINLARNLKLKIVAEGVETEAQRYFLTSVHHCDLLQGFLFSRPLPVDAFETLVTASPSGRRAQCRTDTARGPAETAT